MTMEKRIGRKLVGRRNLQKKMGIRYLEETEMKKSKKPLSVFSGKRKWKNHTPTLAPENKGTRK